MSLLAVDGGSVNGEIHDGITVGSINLGGMTPDEAREVLEDGPAGSLEEIRITGPENISFTAGELDISLDVAATVDQAYAVGREGGLLTRLGDRLRAAWNGASIAPEMRYDPEATRDGEIAAGLGEEPRDATVEVVGERAVVGEAREGRAVDMEATAANVAGAFEGAEDEARIVVENVEPEVSTAEARVAAELAEKAMSGPVVLTAGGEEWELSPAEVGQTLSIVPEDGVMEVSLDEERLRTRLADAYAALTVEPTETGFVVDGDRMSVEEGGEGRRIDEERLFAALEAGLFQGQRRFEVPVVTARPEITAEEAERVKPATLLGAYRTNYLTYDDSPGRVENLRIASGEIDGTILAPGEVFSFNQLAEPLDYYSNKVIVNGQVDYAAGGGLCQASSTLYMAANYAGLNVIERHPHYAELPYVQPGFDATVWFGSLDMKFKNNSGGYLLLREWVDENGYVNAEIWGQPTGKQVEMSSELASTFTDIEGNPVTEWVTFQTVKKDGEVISSGPIHTDTYGYLKP